MFTRVYRVLDKAQSSWTEWTSIDPYALDTAESHPHDRHVTMGQYNADIFQNMLAGGWHTFGNEHWEFTMRLYVKTED